MSSPMILAAAERCEIQALLARAMRRYAERVAASDEPLPAFPPHAQMTATDAMVTDDRDPEGRECAAVRARHVAGLVGTLERRDKSRWSTSRSRDFRKMAIEEFDTDQAARACGATRRASAATTSSRSSMSTRITTNWNCSTRSSTTWTIRCCSSLRAAPSQSGGSKGIGVLPGGVGYQDIGGRVLRYSVRKLEKVPGDEHRDVTLTRRWMDAMGTDIAVIFPSPMLQLGPPSAGRDGGRVRARL